MLFTASRLQTATYLLGVCPFSIAFLVFLNSSVSFVVTDLIGLEKGQGDAVGSLGFADELLALIACPAWGLLSDKIGVRYVCTIGYMIVALALVIFVQASNVYPQLLFGRLIFSLGGSAVSTMVTAILPAVTEGDFHHGSQQHPRRAWRPSLSSDVTITPSRFEEQRSQEHSEEQPDSSATSSSRLAGFVGLFAGCGALIALTVFLPLPAHFENSGSSPPQAIRQSFYVVAAVAFLVAIACFFGLRNLAGEREKHIQWVWQEIPADGNGDGNGNDDDDDDYLDSRPRTTVNHGKNLLSAFYLGFQHPEICLGYFGGLVARASSVAISLFIPLFVNYYYRKSGLCHVTDVEETPSGGPGDIKKSCPEAYILASILTGVSQLIALLTAPVFGYLSERSRRYNLPLICAALSGVMGYVAFPLLTSPQFKGPNGSGSVFVIVALIGISQIGAIVCSLGILSNGVLSINPHGSRPESRSPGESDTGHEEDNGNHPDTEHEPLLTKPGESPAFPDLKELKGCIAGIYSLYGGAGILLLTKLGGLLFDRASTGAPFYIMAIFNAILLLSCLGCVSWRSRRSSG